MGVEDAVMDYIAERKLLFSEKNIHATKEITIKISYPYVVQQDDVQFPVDGVTAGCCVEIDGLDEPGFDLYGMDSLQAINLASNIEPLIERLSAKYNFFWLTGEPYFEE